MGGDKELKIGAPAFKVAGIKSSGRAVNVHAGPPLYIVGNGDEKGNGGEMGVESGSNL